VRKKMKFIQVHIGEIGVTGTLKPNLKNNQRIEITIELDFIEM